MRSLILAALFIGAMAAAPPLSADSPQRLRDLAHEYYQWQNREFPVASSDAGLHTFDNKLADFSAAAILERQEHVHELLVRVRSLDTAGWPKDDQIDAILFRAQLEEPEFDARVLHSEESNPLLYVDECSNAIFSLLKKDYASHHDRAVAATARLQAMPALLTQAQANLNSLCGSIPSSRSNRLAQSIRCLRKA